MNIKTIASHLRTLARNTEDVHRFLQFRADDRQAFNGSVQPAELQFLRSLTEEANALEGPIIEVGTLFGFTTQYLASWKNIDKQLVTIDNFRWNPIGMSAEAHRDFTRRNLHYLCEKANTFIHEGDNVDYYANYSGHPPSLIFIDAGHSYEDVMVDLRWSIDAGVQLIAGHDYSDGCPGVIRAVDECFPGQIERVESLWLHRRTAD